jgi:hypothetical protein
VNPAVYKQVRGASLANVIVNHDTLPAKTADTFAKRNLARRAERVMREVEQLAQQHPRLRKYLPMAKMSRADKATLASCKASFDKAGGHFAKAAERYAHDDHVQNGHAHFVYGLGHLNKVMEKLDFDNREPSGSLEDRDSSEAVSPAKKLSKLLRSDMRKTASTVNVNSSLAGRDLAAVVGTQAVLAKAVKFDPARSESDVPSMPGKPLSFDDVGGELDHGELDRQARAGIVAAQAKLIEDAMRHTVIATRR